MAVTRSTLLPGLALALLLSACSQGNVFELGVGDCFDDPDAAEEAVSDVAVVDCDEPHDNEVYEVFALADGDFPGDEAVREQADQGCVAAFDAFVGTPYLDSELDYAWLVPTQESWDQGDDRTVVCVVYDLSLEPLTGTARGIGR